MPRFEFSLESVLRLRSRARDECRRRLGASLGRLQQAEMRVQNVLFEQEELRNYLRGLSHTGTVQVGMVSRCYMHLAQLERHHQQAVFAVQEAQSVVEADRQRLIEADRQVKALEKLREKRWGEFKREQERKDRLEQDDIQSAIGQRKRLS